MERPAEPFDPQLLHRHAPGLRALVRTLVLDDNRVDDIVQETWLAALKRPPQQTEKAGAWLAVVARRIVQRGKRERARRAQREERVAKQEGLPSTEEIVAREMARRDLVDVVLELEEPYRTTVLLRYFESLGPQEIAARVGAPLETVRTRLKRGLERLREKLDRRNGGDTKAWHLALLPLANLPLGPLAPLAPIPAAGEGALAGTSAAGPSLPWLSFGVLASGAAVLGAAAIGWVLLRGATSDVDPSRDRAPLSLREGARAGAEEPAAIARATSAADATRFLQLALRERSTAAPLEAIEIGSASAPWAGAATLGWSRRTFEREDADAVEERVKALGASDASGRLLVPREDAERFPIALAAHWSPALPPECFATTRELVLERAGVLRGRVRAEGEAAQQALAAGEAIVRLVPTGTRDGRLYVGLWDALRGARGARVQRDGSFAFTGLPLALAYRLEVYAPGAGLGVASRVEFGTQSDADAAETTIELPWRADGARIAGYAAGAEGFPIAGARLALFHLGTPIDAPPQERGRGEGGFGPLEPDPIARVEADDAGLFAFANLPDGRYRLEARADGSEPAQRIFDVQAGAAEPLALRLELGAALEGLVRDAAGAPVAGALVFAAGRQSEQLARTDLEGRFRWRGLAAGGLEVFARSASGVASQRVQLLRGETGWIELELAEPRAARESSAAPRTTVDLRARLVERGTDRGIVGALIEVDAWRGRSGPRGDGGGPYGARPRAALSDAEGVFVLAGLAAGRAHLRVRREGYGETSFEIELDERAAEQRLELAPAARLAGVLRDTAGRALEGRSVIARGSGARIAATDSAGRFAFVDLSPGTWSLGVPGPSSMAEHERGLAALAQVELAPGADARQDLAVDPLPEGRATLEVRSALGSSCALELRGDEPALTGIDRPGRLERGEVARFEALPPGRYRLIARDGDGVLHLRELSLGSEGVELVLGEASSRPIAARTRDGAELELLYIEIEEVGLETGDLEESSFRAGPRSEPGSRGSRGPKGRRSPVSRAVEANAGTWNLSVTARDASGQLFRGTLLWDASEASAERAGSTWVAVLAPWAPEVGPTTPSPAGQGEKARR